MRSDLILKLGEDTNRKLHLVEIQDPQLHEYFHSIAELDRQIFNAQKSLESLDQKSSTT
ncbi:hypothetical protein [Bacillus sp. EB600]|uniref:hypothetical protein n=1 Tax=Bacillus sp. EB600 TaxID=2806345 RepID=UPI00210DBEEB|nr:hypothetical protein [Bacillus sp. EB600]MCQ6278500.1 hypothetical protein [Bacillus sp. EB600]